MFQAELGTAYVPEENWTSKLRARAGYPPYDQLQLSPPFVFSDIKESAQIVGLLERCGYSGAVSLPEECPVYSFDVAVSLGGEDSTFMWTTAKLDWVSLAIALMGLANF